MITRRQFILGSAVAICGGVFFDMRFLEPTWLEVDHQTINLPGFHLPKPIRILHLSDIHESDRISLSYIRKAFLKGLSYKPDLICLTGDFISLHIEEPDAYLATLKLLSEQAPCYACLGNHDGGRWVKSHGGYEDLAAITELLNAAHITLLHNKAKTISMHGELIRLVGLGDYWAGNANPAKAFEGIPVGSPVPCILLCHNPDTKEILDDAPWDLMLCGHTHGGQLDLPLIGTPFAPVRDQRYVAGLNPWENHLIYTTRGIGNLFGMRLNCHPEIAILDIL